MNCIFKWNVKDFQTIFRENNENEKRLADSLRRIELLYAGRHSLDLFSENETTYLMLILNLSEFAPFDEKEIQLTA